MCDLQYSVCMHKLIDHNEIKDRKYTNFTRFNFNSWVDMINFTSVAYTASDSQVWDWQCE